MWMNEHEIDEAGHRHGSHPVAGPAVATLMSLVVWTNRNSDGWPYWQKPARAADKLMDLIQQHDYWDRNLRHLTNVEATPVALRAALRPIKAFRTRMAKELRNGCDFEIFETHDDLRAFSDRKAKEREDAERAELVRLQEKYGVTTC